MILRHLRRQIVRGAIRSASQKRPVVKKSASGKFDWTQRPSKPTLMYQVFHKE